MRIHEGEDLPSMISFEDSTLPKRRFQAALGQSELLHQQGFEDIPNLQTNQMTD